MWAQHRGQDPISRKMHCGREQDILDLKGNRLLGAGAVKGLGVCSSLPIVGGEKVYRERRSEKVRVEKS